MIDFNLEEAQLYRVLTSFFGKEHVVPHMSVLSICGGDLPDSPLVNEIEVSMDSSNGSNSDGSKLKQWAKRSKCLFTIINPGGDPRMVVEFFSGFGNSVSLIDVEHQRYLKPILQAAGVSYCTISNEEFSELLDPRSSLDFFSLLKAKCEALGLSL